VDRETITGAAISAATLIALASGKMIFAGTAGISAAYVAISPGGAGNAVRWFGKQAAATVGVALGIWSKVDEGDQLQKTTGAFFGSFLNAVAESRAKSEEQLDDGEQKSESSSGVEGMTMSQATEAKQRRLLATRLALETIQRIRRSKTRAEYVTRSLLGARLQFEANSRFATETRLAEEAEEARLAIEMKIADENHALEEARLAEAAALAEEDRIFEEARLVEEARLAQEAIVEEEERIAEEEARAAEIARNEEEARIEQARISEAVRLEEEARLAVEARIAQEAKLAECARIEQEAKLEEAKLAEEARIKHQAKLAEEARIEQEAKLAEEARIEQEAKLAEKARIEQEAKLAEQARIEQEAKLAEEARIEQEAKLAEKARIEQEAKLAEEVRIEQEAKLAEIARIEQEAKLAEEARIEQEIKQAEESRLVAEATIAEEARRAVELAEKVRQEEAAATKIQSESTGVEDADFSDQDWEESIRAAQESIEESIVGLEDTAVDDSEKATWEAARNLAQDLKGPSSLADDDDFDMDALAKAARDAVEAFEQGMQPRRATKEQVEATPQPLQDWSKLTVAKLRDELRSRGLPTTGKKAGLVALLKGKKAGLVAALKESDVMLGSEEDVLDESAEGLQPLNSSDEELEELARAARAAVEQFETTATEQASSEEFDENNLDFSDLDMEAIGRAAREAVEMFDDEDEPSDEVLWQLENEQEELLPPPSPSPSKTDFASMKVTELKEELRIRGLPIGGKKADLIERLKAL
jgi:UDP-3-O-[3-hydroxymyristoyl] glucosamine N-acyltransferase